jgi:hypothetical protein
VVFSLAGLEKVSRLRSHAAAWHPIMLMSRYRRRHATTLIALSLVGDVAAVLLLAIWPAGGAQLCIALLAIYSTAAIRVHAEAEDAACQCFWKFMNTYTKTGLIVRNALLVASAALVLVRTPRASIGGLATGGALLVLIAGSTRAIEHVAKSARTSVPADLVKGVVAESRLASPLSTGREERYGE